VNGTDWKTVATQRPEECGNDVVRLPADDEAVRYVRMQGIERRTTWGYSIHEMGVYGAPAS
jgi:hyaluronoglucosaminidase